MDIKRSPAISLRALLTECTPYELPVEVNTEWIYRWIDKNAYVVNADGMKVVLHDEFDYVVSSLLGANDLPLSVSGGKSVRTEIKNPTGPEVPTSWGAPMRISVRRDISRKRDLDLLNVKSQLSLAYLYRNKEDAILYFTNRDSSSLRHPRGKTSYGKSLYRRFLNKNARRQFTVEAKGRPLSTYNSYFYYDAHPFVGSFYDSFKWRTLEAKWEFLRRIDVANCFKSIYTHSISWATRTELLNKLHLLSPAANKTGLDLGRSFDKVMQCANWGETHGIPVGPEASRIFAEIVFQSIDRKIHSLLAKSDSVHQKYELLRYVDDYFIYANDQAVVEEIHRIVVAVLRAHQFDINPSKTRDYVTPFTSQISALKSQLKQFLRGALPTDGALPAIDSREIGVQLKTVLLRQEGEASAVGSSLSLIDRSLQRFIEHSSKNTDDRSRAIEVFEYVWEFVQSFSYQYLSCPSVSNCMKVVRLIRAVHRFPWDFSKLDLKSRELLSVQADDYIRFLIKKLVERLVSVEQTDIEICYLLAAASSCKIDIGLDDNIGEKLLRRLEGNASMELSPKSDLAFVFCALSLLRSSIDCGYRDTKVFTRAFGIVRKICEGVFQESFVPVSVVPNHSVQELLLLSIVSSTVLSPDEKEDLLDRSWVRNLVNSHSSNKDGIHSRRVNKFLKRLWRCAATRSPGSVAYFWEDLDLDQQLFEKEPQFVY